MNVAKQLMRQVSVVQGFIFQIENTVFSIIRKEIPIGDFRLHTNIFSSDVTVFELCSFSVVNWY